MHVIKVIFTRKTARLL